MNQAIVSPARLLNLSIKDLLVLSCFYLIGVLLMYIGYFYPYSDTLFIPYLLFMLAFGVCYVIYFGTIAEPQVALYSWLLMFMFFPKKALQPDLTALLNIGFGFTDTALAMYYVLDVFFVVAMIVSIARRRVSENQEAVPSNVQFLYRVGVSIVLLGVIHIVFAWLNQGTLSISLGRMLVELWPFVVGLVVFRAATQFIRTQKQVETIFSIAIASCGLLLVEFTLVTMNLLPSEVVYYSKNDMGRFTSVLQSGDLIVGQLLIVGLAATLYFYFSRRKVFFLMLTLVFCYLLLNTYDRDHLLAAVILAVLIIANASSTGKKFVILSGFAVILLLGFDTLLFRQQGLYTLGSLLDIGQIKVGVYEGGYFSTDSMLSRIGAYLRGLDVFLYSPLFGVGPGNAVVFMSSRQVYPIMADLADIGKIGGMVGEAYAFLTYEGRGYIVENYVSPLGYTYARMISGTDPHNLAIRMFAEFGMLGVLGVLATCKALFANFLKFKRESQIRGQAQFYSLYLAKLCSYAALFSYGAYFMFQAQPQIMGLLFLLLGLATTNGKNWHSQDTPGECEIKEVTR